MSIPILRQGDCLIAFIQPSVSDDEWLELHREMGERVRAHRARSVVVDVSGLDVLDSFATRMLRSIGQMARLGGADAVIVGIAPDVAYAMVQLGLTLQDLDTALDLEEGLARLRQRGARSP
jgi:rsbT antagonist protein RsbS